MPTQTEQQEYYRDLYSGARKGAERRGLSFDLTRAQFDELVRQAQGCCTVTGIPFVFEKHPTAKRRPFAPSLDRIDNAKGYTIGNVRLVCLLLNLAMNQWGIEPLRRVAECLVAGATLPAPLPPPPVEHYEHVWKNVTYMTVPDYLYSQGKAGDASYQIVQKMAAFCSRLRLPFINTLVNQTNIREYRGPMYLAFPIEVLEAFC